MNTPPAPLSPGPDRTGATALWLTVMPGVFVFLWATGFIGGKFGLPYAEPFTFLLVRFIIVTTLLTLLALATRAPWPSNWPAAAHIAVAGLLVHATYLGGVFSSLNQGIPAGLSALIVGIQPLLTALAVGPFLGEKLTARQWSGIGLGLFGMILVVARKLDMTGADAAGVAFSVVALAGITAGTLYQKRFCTAMDLRSGSAIQFAVSAVVMAALAFTFETMKIQWTGEFIFALSWLIIAISFGAISVLMVIIRRGAAAKVASLFYLVPPLTAVMAFFAFGETLGVVAIIGMGIAVIGVGLVIKGG